MGRFNNNVARRCLKVPAWPIQDRELYAQATIDDPFL